MRVSDRVRAKATALLAEAPLLFTSAAESDGIGARREASVASACQRVELPAPNVLGPHRRHVHAALIHAIGRADSRVDGIAATLQQLIRGVDDGLLDPIEVQGRSMAFGDFLDHAEHHLQGGRHAPAGAIAGVVFVDTVRRPVSGTRFRRGV